MKRWWKLFGFAVVIGIVAHLVMVLALPNLIMGIAIKRIAANAGGVNKILHNPRVTPQNQAIVRSSPDLAYSLCVLDLSDGPVRIVLGPSQNYVSAAFYSANTDNVFTLKAAQFGAMGPTLMVAREGDNVAQTQGQSVVRLPSSKGLLLVRRLAPDAQAFARVDTERRQDVCESAC
jgi:uncharacterized membrane protein